MPSGTLDMLSVWPAGRRSHEYNNNTAQSDISHQRSSSDGPTRLLSLPHSSHIRGDSAIPATSATMSSLAPPQTATTTSSAPKGHISPGKTPGTWTPFDHKHVTREMQRSQNILPLPNSGIIIAGSTATLVPDDAWSNLNIQLLPLFNGEHLRTPIEDLNALVKRHISAKVSLSPSKAMVALETDATALISSGMETLSAKLHDVDDYQLVSRVVSVWVLFWNDVLAYVEGALLPLQTDPLLNSLYRTKPPHRNSSPTRSTPTHTLNHSSSSLFVKQVDVRSIVLRAFRDLVVLPIAPRLVKLLSSDRGSGEYEESLFQQMLLVLASQHDRPRPQSFSLTSQAPQASSGEAAISELLRASRSSAGLSLKPHTSVRRAAGPGSLLDGTPRDRRGLIARKTARTGWAPGRLILQNEDLDGNEDMMILEREREREALEELKNYSPRADKPNKGMGHIYGREVEAT